MLDQFVEFEASDAVPITEIDLVCFDLLEFLRGVEADFLVVRLSGPWASDLASTFCGQLLFIFGSVLGSRSGARSLKSGRSSDIRTSLFLAGLEGFLVFAFSLRWGGLAGQGNL